MGETIRNEDDALLSKEPSIKSSPPVDGGEDMNMSESPPASPRSPCFWLLSEQKGGRGRTRVVVFDFPGTCPRGSPGPGSRRAPFPKSFPPCSKAGDGRTRDGKVLLGGLALLVRGDGSSPSVVEEREGTSIGRGRPPGDADDVAAGAVPERGDGTLVDDDEELELGVEWPNPASGAWGGAASQRGQEAGQAAFRVAGF
ncbi:hypothetical protein HPB47_026327, partial [Ixodes persulcatus]